MQRQRDVTAADRDALQRPEAQEEAQGDGIGRRKWKRRIWRRRK